MSTDGTFGELEAARAFLPMLRIGHAAAIGLGAARDVGWRLARAPIVAFTDDDCYPHPDYVDHVLAVFSEDPELAFAGGQIRLFDPDDLPETIDLRTKSETIEPRTFLPAGAIQGANFACRRRHLEAVEGFDVRLGAGTPFPCEDIDLIARIAWAGGRGAYDPRPLVWHHHGRRGESDLRKLNAGYDAGRGAYYAKFIRRPDTRYAWARAWLRSMIRIKGAKDVRRVIAELRFARQFLATYD
jgi:GT2 family glycosyltransferase